MSASELLDRDNAAELIERGFRSATIDRQTRLARFEIMANHCERKTLDPLLLFAIQQLLDK